MKTKHSLIFSLCSIILFATTAKAQMFYSSGSKFDSADSTSYEDYDMPAMDNTPKKEAPFEKLISKEIRERIKADASYIIGEPEETMCFGIARKSPMKRSMTLNGYALTGNCGTLNSVGVAEIQKTLFDSKSYNLDAKKATSCIMSPELMLRFRKGFDFVDIALSGGNCPVVKFIYAGQAKDFSARPMKEWLDNFIKAVSNDLKPVSENDAQEQADKMFKKTAPKENVEQIQKQPKKTKQKVWGRRVVRPQPQKETVEESNAQIKMDMDTNVPPPEY